MKFITMAILLWQFFSVSSQETILSFNYETVGNIKSELHSYNNHTKSESNFNLKGDLAIDYLKLDKQTPMHSTIHRDSSFTRNKINQKVITYYTITETSLKCDTYSFVKNADNTDIYFISGKIKTDVLTVYNLSDSASYQQNAIFSDTIKIKNVNKRYSEKAMQYVFKDKIVNYMQKEVKKGRSAVASRH